MATIQVFPLPASVGVYYDDDYLRSHTGTGNTYARKINGKPAHCGIDLPPSVRGKIGEPVLAPWDGTIRLRSFGPAYGRQVTVVADDGTGAFFAHLNRIYVIEGQRVKAGDHIADLGNTGSQTVGPHLHLEKRRDWEDWNSVENPYQELKAVEDNPVPTPQPIPIPGPLPKEDEVKNAMAYGYGGQKDGRIDAFTIYENPDNPKDPKNGTMYHGYYSNVTGKWTWDDLGGTVETIAEDGIQFDGSIMRVFAQVKGYLWQKWWDGAAWNGWQPLRKVA